MKLKIALIALTMYSCGSAESYLKHEFGRIYRNDEKTLSAQCSNTKLPETSEQNRTINKATDYLRDILDHVIDQNTKHFANSKKNPFNKKYLKDRFCVRAIDTGKINAYAQPITGEIFAELSIIKLAENDAQIATFLSHELSHILMSHTSDDVLPDTKLKELSYLNNREVKAIAKNCYKPSAYRFFTAASLRTVLGFDKRLDSLDYQLQVYDRGRSQQVWNRSKGLPDLINCNFVQKRQQQIQNLIYTGDAGIWSKSDRVKRNWEKVKKKFYKFKNNRDIQNSLKKAEQILLSILPAGIDDADYFNNWKEQEADEVGLELMYHSGFDIKEAPKFWLNMMQATSYQAKKCIDLIKKRGTVKRGSSTHPHLCYRYLDLGTKEPNSHREYKRQTRSSKNIFPNRLSTLKNSL